MIAGIMLALNTVVQSCLVYKAKSKSNTPFVCTIIMKPEQI